MRAMEFTKEAYVARQILLPALPGLPNNWNQSPG